MFLELALIAARLAGAFYAPIQDCDEVFNFWEPTHYLTHGSGLQTWEWSPEYAIRSWAYVLPHAGIVKAAGLVGMSETQQFFVLRVCLSLFSSFSELYLARVVRKIDTKVAKYFLMISVFATGLFQAAPAYLPSTFAMYFVTLSMARFLQSYKNVVSALSLLAVGAFLGWPFVLLLAVPICISFLMQTMLRKQYRLFVSAIAATVVSCSMILANITIVDSYFYQKFVVVPFNIVAYNVLYTSDESGPQIFGTEPFYYYIFNLLLNFNIMLPLALLALLVVQRPAFLVPLTALAIWVIVLSLQAHKEERFMYPVYSLIALAAAVSLSGFERLARAFGHSLKPLVQLAVFATLSLFMVVSILRSVGLVSYYAAPLSIYADIPPEATVCVGREWYRFPSSYLSGSKENVKFVESGFDGLLPSEFRSITELPAGMNSVNAKNPDFLTPVSQCDYYIDITQPVNTELGELDAAGSAEWQEDLCLKFLNTNNTPLANRAVYNPAGASWLKYCRYKRVEVDT